jgi:hypothetical protein
MNKIIHVEGIKLVAYLNPEGDSYIEGLTIDNQDFPVQWVKKDWQRLHVGSRLEILDHFSNFGLWQSPYRITGIVESLDLEGEYPWVEMTVNFEGHSNALHPDLWGSNWLTFYPDNESLKNAVVTEVKIS